MKLIGKKLVRCIEGHVYNAATHEACPVCGAQPVPVAKQEVAAEPAAAASDGQQNEKTNLAGKSLVPSLRAVIGAVVLLALGAWAASLFLPGQPESRTAVRDDAAKSDHVAGDAEKKSVVKLESDQPSDTRPPTPIATECDRYAMSNIDLDRVAGVAGIFAVRDIDPALAVPACERAVQAAPNERRLLANLARAYRAASNDPAAADTYKKAADQGSAFGAYGLALMLRAGSGIPADPAEARRLFHKAAQDGLVLAMTEYAWMLDTAQGGPQNFGEARRWYERAAESGSVTAINAVGNYYLNGKGGPADPVKAREWFERAVREGNADGLANLGYLQENGFGLDKNVGLARANYEKGANAGSVIGMIRLGMLLLSDKGGRPEPENARRWLTAAAERGAIEAMSELGYGYLYGKFGSRDPVTARQWFEKAANGGDAAAMNEIGVFYHNGSGIPRDYQMAATWYKRAVQKGNIAAAANLGVLYEFGTGAPQNFTEAWRLFEMAAARGNAAGMLHLGQMAEYGKGMNRDLNLARTWYLKAAEAGNADALWRVAYLADHYGHDKNLEAIAKVVLEAAKKRSNEALEALFRNPERSLSRELRAAIEAQLAKEGYYSGSARGRFERNAREALEAYMAGGPSTAPVRIGE